MMWKTMIALAATVAWIGCSDSQTAGDASTDADTAAPAVETQPMTEAPVEETAAADTASSSPVDGELPFPNGYTEWPVFLPSVDRADAKQVRDIYLNTAAQGATEGAPLPDGSVLVMELHTVKLDDAGEPVLDASGRLQKDALSKIFVMAKNPGWGEGATIPNGSWVYGAFEPNGDPAQVDYATCRSCHVPMVDKDFVPRLDEYLAQR